MPRPRKPAHVYRRKDRRGLYAYLSRAEPHVSLQTDDEEEAARRLAELLKSRRLQEAAAPEGPLAGLFGASLLRTQTNNADNTAYNRGRDGLRILAWLAEHRVVSVLQVNRALVERYKEDRLADEVGPARINAELGAWKAAMRIAVERETVPEAVLRAFIRLKEPRPAPHQRGLTLDEISDFLCAVEDERYFWLFRATAGSGIRFDEAVHLHEKWIADASLTITPLDPGECPCHPVKGWKTKNYRYRTIPVSPEAVAAARAYAAVKHSMALDPKSVWKELQRARKAAGSTWHWSMHDLRRAWGSHLLAMGCKLSDLSRWYGHGDLLTTMRYLRVVEDESPDPASLPL